MTSRTDTIQIDNTAPQTQIDIINTSPINGWYAVTPQISLTATDTQSGVEQTTYEINGGITQTYSGQFSLPTSGEYTITYRSRDHVGNVEVEQTLQLSVDTEPPLSTHAYGGILGLNNWYVETGELSFSAVDTHSGIEQIEYQLGSGAWDIYSQPFDLSADGVHQIRHRATDYAGHVEAQQTVTIQIDTQAPETTLSANQVAVNNWYPADVELTLDAIDTGSGVFQTFYSLDGGSLQVYHAPISVSDDGNYIIEFTSVDVAGNTEPPQSFQLGIDTIPPTTTALYNAQPLSAHWYTDVVTVALEGHDEGSGVAFVEYTLNGSGWQRYSNPFTLSANGEYEIKYRTADQVGYVGAIQSDIVRIDRTDPELSIHVNGTHGNEGWFVSPVTMRLDFRDPVSGIDRTEYEIGAGWQIYQAPVRLTTEGQTRINASAYDRAGNYRVADTFVKIDTLPPTMSQVSCPDRAPIGDLIIQTNANDLSSGIVHWEVVRVNEHGHRWTFSGAGNGRRLNVRVEDGNFFTFQSIKLTDRAGHVFVSPLDCYVVLDLQAPEPIVPTEQPTDRPTQTPFPTVTLTPTPTSTPTATWFIQFVTNTPRPTRTVIAGSETPTVTTTFGSIPTLMPLVDRMMTLVALTPTATYPATMTSTPTSTPRVIQTSGSFIADVLTRIAPTITPTPTVTNTPTLTPTGTNTLTPTPTVTRTPTPTATPTQFVAMGELPNSGGTNNNSQDDNLSLEQALLAALLATGTASVAGAKVAEAKEKRQQAVKAENQANDKANQQKIAQAEKVKQDDQAYAKSMVEQLQQHGQFWLSAALVSVLGIGVCAYLLSNPQYDHLPIAYDCEMGLVQHVVPSTSTTIVQYPSAGTKNPFIGANPFVMIAVLGLVGKLLETAGRVIKTGTSIQKATGLSPIVAGAIGAVLVGAGVLGNMILQHADPAILAPYIEQAYPHVGFTSDQTADEFIEKYRRQEPCLLVQAIPTDDPNIFEFIAHPFNVPEGYRIEWYKGTELQGCQGNSCRIQFESGEHHVKARLIVDTYETSVTLSRTYVEITPETSQLETCQIQYIAHISASEASYTSPAGIAAIVLSQINHYNQPHPYNNPPEPINNLYGFKVALDYVNEARAPLGLPLISEAQQKELAYSEYKSDCEKGIISAPRNDPNNGFEYDIALRMVTLMSQDLDNPLGRFNHNLFGISDNDFELLKYIKDNVNYTQEKGIQISREVVDEWYNRYQTARQGFIPEWWPPDPSKDHPLIFWNDDGASVMIHTDASADAPLNWYCPQDLSIANLNLALVYQDHTSEIHCEFCTSGTGIRATNPDYFRGCTRLGTNIIVEWINADTLIERIPTSTPIYEGE